MRDPHPKAGAARLGAREMTDPEMREMEAIRSLQLAVIQLQQMVFELNYKAFLAERAHHTTTHAQGGE